VPRGVDHKHTRCVDLKLIVDLLGLLLESVNWEIRRTNLLSNTTRFALLYVRVADLVEQLRLAGIDVAENANNRRPEMLFLGLRLVAAAGVARILVRVFVLLSRTLHHYLAVA